MSRIRGELAAVTLFALLLAWLVTWSQPVWKDGGLRWDGGYYYDLAVQLLHGGRPRTAAPFVYRLAVPYLAGWVAPGELIAGFRSIAVASGIASVILFWAWLIGFPIVRSVRLGLVAAFALQYHGALRLGYFFPTLPYAAFWVALLAGLLVLRWLCQAPTLPRTLVACVTCAAGAFVRETMLLAPLVMLFAANPIQATRPFVVVPWRRVWPVVAALGSCVAGVAATHQLATANNAYGFANEAMRWLLTKSPLAEVGAVFLAFGPLLAVFLLAPRTTWRFFAGHQHLAVLVAACTLLGILGGTNTEVFLFWAAPAVFAGAGIVLTQHAEQLLRPAVIVPLVAAQLLAERAFFAIPTELAGGDPLVLFAPLADAGYLQLWSHYAGSRILWLVLLSHLAFALALFAVVRFMPRRPRSAPDY